MGICVMRAARRSGEDARPTPPGLVVQRLKKQEQSLLEKAQVGNILAGGRGSYDSRRTSRLRGSRMRMFSILLLINSRKLS